MVYSARQLENEESPNKMAEDVVVKPNKKLQANPPNLLQVVRLGSLCDLANLSQQPKIEIAAHAITLGSVLTVRANLKYIESETSGFLLDLLSGDYFELNSAALQVWRSFDGKSSLRKIAKEFSATRHVPLTTTEQAIKEFVAELQRFKLILAAA